MLKYTKISVVNVSCNTNIAVITCKVHKHCFEFSYLKQLVMLNSLSFNLIFHFANGELLVSNMQYLC